MSTFNIQNINNATISLKNGEKFNVAKLSIKLDNKLIIDNKEISMVIENGVLIIKTK